MSVRRVTISVTTEGVGDLHVLPPLVERSESLHGWTIRFGPMAASWATRASLARRAQRSVSYAELARRLSASLRATLLGGPET